MGVENPLPSANHPPLEEAVLAETLRLHRLSELHLDNNFTIDDGTLVEFLDTARNSVSMLKIPDLPLCLPVAQRQHEGGTLDVMTPVRLILMAAQIVTAVRGKLQEVWSKKYPGEPALFDAFEQPTLENVVDILAGRRPDTFEDYVHHAKKVAALLEGLSDEIMAGSPDTEPMRGASIYEGPAGNIKEETFRVTGNKLERIFTIAPMQVKKAMSQHEKYKPFMRLARREDATRLHTVYKKVTVPTEKLIRFDPRFADLALHKKLTNRFRDRGGMMMHLAQGDDADDILEGILYGSTVVLEEDDDIYGYYEILMDAGRVMKKMSDSLHFDGDRNYNSLADLPMIRNLKLPGGVTRTINILDEYGTLSLFKAAKEGKLAWSVDHIVLNEGDVEGIQLYAGAGTATKLENYGLAEAAGKEKVVLRTVKIKAIDARQAAGVLGIDPVSADAWPSKAWKMDEYEMIRLDPSVSNTASNSLNDKLGAELLFAVNEICRRDGILLELEWQFRVQNLPARRIF